MRHFSPASCRLVAVIPTTQGENDQCRFDPETNKKLPTFERGALSRSVEPKDYHSLDQEECKARRTRTVDGSPSTPA
jgi:hypothetical protein